MSKIVWGSSSAHLFENGADHGVLYPIDGKGIPWNGLVSVNENDSGASEVIKYYDGDKYRSQVTLGLYSATVNCYTYPDVLDRYEDLNNGLLADARKGNTYFNFSYRTLTDKGYKLHFVYNAIATPVNKSHTTISDSVDPVIFGWDLATVPVDVVGARPSSHFYIDSTLAHPWILERVEGILYGDDTQDPSFPSIDLLMEIFQDGSIMQVIDHGDGSWTATGPDDMVNMLGPGIFEIVSPSAIFIGPDTYKVSSY